MDVQYVYCLENEEMPNICKCGGTANSPYNRCDQISNTSLPVKCKVAYFVEVNNWRIAEKYIHNRLDELGIKRFQGREWFKCKPSDVICVFEECKRIYGYDDNKMDIYTDDVQVGNKRKIRLEVNVTNKEKKYYCGMCNYETYDSGNYVRHEKSKKHIAIINESNLKEYYIIKKERDELKSKLLMKNIEIKHLTEMLEFYKSQK